MLKITRLAAFAILGVIAASAYAEDTSAASKPVATVNGVAIPQERVDMLVEVAASQGQSDTPELRKNVVGMLVRNELAVQEAIRKGLDKQPDFVRQMELTKQDFLAKALVQDYVKQHPVSDEEISREYAELKTALQGAKEYRVRHILLSKDSEAKSVAAKLKKGGKFEALAERYSMDASSKGQGGELGWFSTMKIQRNMVKPFGDALLKLSKGQVSEPVQTQYGWHLIQMEDVRDLKIPTLEEAKSRIVQILQQRSVDGMLADLRKNAKITE